MTTIKLRRGTAAQWTTVNPILAQGEPGFETDTGKHKIGNGITNWAGLKYYVDEVDLSNAVSTEVSARDAAINTAVSNLINGAPTALDTLLEISSQLVNDESAVGSIVSALASHTSNTANPHNVTKEQVGLGSVPNIDTTAAIGAETSRASDAEATKVPKWQSSTAYTAGDVVMAPDGSIVKRLTSGTSGTSYTSANWQTVSTVSGTQANTEFNNLIDGRASTHWNSVNVGVRVDTFMVRQTTDGDVAAQISAFLADSALTGKRRLVGHALVNSMITMPDDTWFDGAQAVIEMTANSTRLMKVGSRCHIDHVRGLGKGTDYVPSSGSSSQLKSGLYLNGASDVVIDEAVLENFAEAGIYAVNAPRATIGRLYFDGVHGRPAAPGAVGSWIVGGNIVIPHLDARSRALTAVSGSIDWNLHRLDVKNASIGMTTGYVESGWMIDTVRGTDIIGQHLIYHQCGDGLIIRDVLGRRISLNVVKVQMTSANTTDSFGMVLGSVVGYSSDCALFVTNTGVDKTDAVAWTSSTDYNFGDLVSNSGNYYQVVTSGTSASSGGPSGTSNGQADGSVVWNYANAGLKIFKGVEVGKVAAYDCNKLAHLNSIQGLQASSMAGHALKDAAVTLQNLKDARVENIDVNGSGWAGVYIRGGQGGFNQRLTLSSVTIRNPALPTSTSVVAGIYCSDTLASDLTIKDFDIFADNGQMDYGMYFSSGTDTTLTTTRFDRGRTRGWTTAPTKFYSQPISVGSWNDIDTGGSVTNFPTMQSQNSAPIVTVGENSLIAAPYDPVFATTGLAAMTPGVLTCVRMRVGGSRGLASLVFTTASVATAPTTGQCFMGVYEGVAGGALLGFTGDLSATSYAATGDKIEALTPAIAGRPLGSYVYAVFLFNGTTAPTIRGNSTTGKANINGAVRFATAGSGLTALPATLPTLVVSTIQPFVGIKPV